MRLFVHSISFKILWEKKKTKLEDVSLSHKTVYMHMPFFCIFLYKAAISCVFWINWLSQVNIIKFLFNCLSSIFFFPDWKNLQLWACLLGYRLRQCSVVRSQLTQLVWITTQQDTVILINRKHWLEDWLGSVFYERLYLQLNYNHVFHNQLNVNPHSQAGEKVWGKSLSELRSPLVVLINTAVKKELSKLHETSVQWSLFSPSISVHFSVRQTEFGNCQANWFWANKQIPNNWVIPYTIIDASITM